MTGDENSPGGTEEIGEYSSSKTDEATRITRIVLVAVIVVLLGGLAALLLLSGSDDDGARDAVSSLDGDGIEIRDGTTTTEEQTTTTEGAATTEGPVEDTTPAPGPAPSPGAPPPPPPPPAPDAPPANLEVFYADNGSGFLPVRKGQSSTVSIRNTGGSNGFWALNATGPVRVDGSSGINGECGPGQILTIRVTIADGASVPGSSEESIRFEVAGGPTTVIPVLVLPPL